MGAGVTEGEEDGDGEEGEEGREMEGKEKRRERDVTPSPASSNQVSTTSSVARRWCRQKEFVGGLGLCQVVGCTLHLLAQRRGANDC